MSKALSKEHPAMTISVLIPVYNGSRTIRAALDSVLRQTLPADEILVMDDGSTDDSYSLLKSYTPRITAFQQKNKGVSAARNSLCAKATGDLIAFLDQDDLWHPGYLWHQSEVFSNYPNAVAFVAGHVDFYGYGSYEWTGSDLDSEQSIEVLDPLRFLKKLDAESGYFVSPGMYCVPKRVLLGIGREPFCEEVSGADDAYLLRRLALLGSVVFAPASHLLAYRITREAASTDRLRMFGLLIRCYEILEDHYRFELDGRLYKTFRLAFASQRRQYAKRLMGAGIIREARRQIYLSVFNTSHPGSIVKSLAFLLVSYAPAAMHPEWPPAQREWRTKEGK